MQVNETGKKLEALVLQTLQVNPDEVRPESIWFKRCDDCGDHIRVIYELLAEVDNPEVIESLTYDEFNEIWAQARG